MDVDGSTSEKRTFHSKHGVSSRTEVIVSDESDTTFVDHVKEGLDLAEVLKLLLNELRIGLEVDAADEQGTTRLLILVPTSSKTTATSTATTTTTATTASESRAIARRTWTTKVLLRRPRLIGLSKRWWTAVILACSFISRWRRP